MRSPRAAAIGVATLSGFIPHLFDINTTTIITKPKRNFERIFLRRWQNQFDKLTMTGCGKLYEMLLGFDITKITTIILYVVHTPTDTDSVLAG